MRVLVVTPTCHIRLPGGVQEEIYAVVDLLKKLGHDVSFATVDSPPQGEAVLAAVEKRLDMKILAVNPGSDDKAVWLWRGLREPALLHRAAWLSQKMVETPAWDAFFKDKKPDIVLSFCSHTWPFLRDAKKRGARTVFRSHDFEPEFYWEMLSQKQRLNPLNWARRWTQWMGEKLATHWGDAIAPTPLREVDALYERWKPGHSSVLTLAYLPAWLRPPQVRQGKRPLDVFYMGASYNIPFHLRGVRTLIEEIAPKALAKVPGAFRFNIIGAKLPADLKARCDGKNIIYHDYVPDLQKFLDDMDIGIAPVDTGRSIKGKVFGPITRSFPMVIAPNCLSGYPLEHGKNVMIAKEPDDYVAALLVLRDDVERKKIADGAYAFAQEYFSEARLLADLKKALDIAIRT